MEFMHQWDEGAYFRAVWTKTTINIQPESQLSMKVVLGFEMRSMKKIRINEPKAQLPTTLKQPTTSLVNGSKAQALKSSMSQQQIMATNAPRNCARQQTGSMFHLNLFYFLRQLHRVTAGLRFAPLTGPHMTTPTSTPSPTLTSANLAVLTDNATTTNNIIPINSQKNIFNLGSSLIWLYCSWIQLYRTDCFNDVAQGYWSYSVAEVAGFDFGGTIELGIMEPSDRTDLFIAVLMDIRGYYSMVNRIIILYPLYIIHPTKLIINKQVLSTLQGTKTEQINLN